MHIICWRSQTLFGDPDAKNFHCKNFLGPPSYLQYCQESLFAIKLWVNPLENHIKSIFTGNFVSNFSSPVPLRVKTFKGPLFALVPPTSVCEWSPNMGSIFCGTVLSIGP